jgi:hypothetical protein
MEAAGGPAPSGQAKAAPQGRDGRVREIPLVHTCGQTVPVDMWITTLFVREHHPHDARHPVDNQRDSPNRHRLGLSSIYAK